VLWNFTKLLYNKIVYLSVTVCHGETVVLLFSSLEQYHKAYTDWQCEVSVDLCHVQVRKKDQINIESKLKTVRFIGKY